MVAPMVVRTIEAMSQPGMPEEELSDAILAVCVGFGDCGDDWGLLWTFVEDMENHLSLWNQEDMGVLRRWDVQARKKDVESGM